MEKINNLYVYRLVEKIFKLAIIGMVLLVLSIIFYNTDLRGVESNVVYSIQLILEDNSLLYQSPESPPFNITQYSPLYYIINDLIISVLQIDQSDPFKIRVISRTISILILILSLIFIKNILQFRLNIDKKTSLIVVLTYFIISFPWFNISRPDVLILLFFILSIRSIFLYQERSRESKYAIYLGILLTLGVFSKLTMLIYILAYGIYMIIARQWKMLFLSAASFVIASLVLGFLLHILNYDLSYIYENIIKGIDNGYDLIAAFSKTYVNYINYFGFVSLVFALASINCIKNWRKINNKPIFLYLITLSYTAAAFSFISALKVGSAINYFNELLVSILIFLTYYLENFHLNLKKLYRVFFMIFGISIALNHGIFYAPALANNMIKRYNADSEDYSEIREFLDANLENHYFYSDSRKLAMSYPDKCILFPKEIHNITYEREVYDYSILKEWANKKLRYLVVKPRRNELYDIDIDNNYILKHKYDDFYLYELNAYQKWNK